MKRDRQSASASRCRSPPVRGRGLKRDGRRVVARPVGVAPRAGARIETCFPQQPRQRSWGSPPVRGRGLKRDLALDVNDLHEVAPRAGARIETQSQSSRARAVEVAPRAGARIETVAASNRTASFWVAPRAGARIETWKRAVCLGHGLSPPVRGRGLKRSWPVVRSADGLVAPRAGARIETLA